MMISACVGVSLVGAMVVSSLVAVVLIDIIHLV